MTSIDFFSSEHWFSQCQRLLSHFYGTFCVLSHYTSLPLVRLLQLPAVQCCCNFLTDFGWKGRLVSIPMVDRERIFLLYLLYYCFPILVSACMTRRLYAYMLSQIRKTSTRVEQKFGGGDPPLVGNLAYPYFPNSTIIVFTPRLGVYEGPRTSLQHN